MQERTGLAEAWSRRTGGGRLCPLAVATALVLASPVARAQARPEGRPAVSASAAMGAGAVGGDPASALDLGVDIAGDTYSLGLGGRAHYTIAGGLRTEDWDETSELIGMIRYALYESTGQAVAVSAAAGELGGVRHGHGTVLAGYASGLSLDHGRFGAQVRAAHHALAAEAVIDDLAAPRILGLRAAAEVADHTRIGVSFSADVRAPAAGGDAAVGIAAVDGEVFGDAGGGRYRGRLYADAALAAGLGAGLHTGAGGSAELGGAGVRASGRVELRLTSGGYIPGYFGPLYERDRYVLEPGPGGGASQLDRARRGGLGGSSGLGELAIEWPGVAVGSAGYAARPGLADHLIFRAQAPHFDRVQAAFWAAFGVGRGPGRGGALAAEIRAKLPDPFVVSLDVARLYRDGADAAPVPVWTAIASFGAVFGD